MTNDISRGSNAVGSVFAVLDRKSEIDPESSDKRKTDSIRGRVELRKVVFAYPSRPDQLILKGLSLKINAGTTVALVGQSGSGKSTIISLIERFYDPINGSVCIDDKDIKDYNLRSLRSHIALVSQEPTLFAGTIYENIAYGTKDARESEIRKAAILANAHEFISGMKDGYDTQCGERGVQLSGGQKQRIALARAILKDPAILLLDEATSALDSVSESLVQEALEKMMVGRTCIVVAHRLSTIQKSNSIAVIKDGKVVEQGSHSDLWLWGAAARMSHWLNHRAAALLTAKRLRFRNQDHGPTLTGSGAPDFNLIPFFFTFPPESSTATSPPTTKLSLFVYQNKILYFTLVAKPTLKLTVDPFETASSAAPTAARNRDHLFPLVVGDGDSRGVLGVKKGEVYVSVVYAFVLHSIAELEIEVYGVVGPGGGGIIGRVEGGNVRRLSHMKRAVRPEVNMKRQQQRQQPPASSPAMDAVVCGGGGEVKWMSKEDMVGKENHVALLPFDPT
ncbi:putative multidrug resistance protein [Sesamum alatum]|uniref:Multidrug resistance protein n=1 Tax=Sesamum alatum TaxID=300844 RepID=A0AAE1XZY9_9LAMI|nr:putative multidrug resistance protein [Sesamum alatum]